jgi:hypothetical protein
MGISLVTNELFLFKQKTKKYGRLNLGKSKYSSGFLCNKNFTKRKMQLGTGGSCL